MMGSVRALGPENAITDLAGSASLAKHPFGMNYITGLFSVKFILLNVINC